MNRQTLSNVQVADFATQFPFLIYPLFLLNSELVKASISSRRNSGLATRHQETFRRVECRYHQAGEAGLRDLCINSF